MMDKKQREKCLQEVKLLQTVDHPNIVKYLDSFVHENELHIAIEWAEKGDLKRYIRKLIQEKDYLDELRVFDFTRQIACALQHMHEKRIIHRDLKPANILVFSDGKLKLGDLGLGRFLSVETIKAFSKVGTPLYMSPELIRNTGYDFKTDVWSLGCVCYEMILLKSPFITDNKLTLYDLFTKIEKGDYPKITDGRLSNDIKDLVDQMLIVEPEQRISLTEVIKQIDNILNSIEDKPKIDPFIVMEDILEKLRLINYEINYCKKFKKELMTKYTFSCNIYGKPNTPGVLSFEGSSNMNNLSQFRTFYDLCSWLIYIIKLEVSINKLSTVDIPSKVFEKKKNIDEMLTDLLNSLKSIGIKILENSKISNGFGEGVCLIVTQLLDRYLISQNYIFKKPLCESILANSNSAKKTNTNNTNNSNNINSNNINGNNSNNNKTSRPSTKNGVNNSKQNSETKIPQNFSNKKLPDIDIAVEVIDEVIQLNTLNDQFDNGNSKEQKIALNSRTTINNTRNMLASRQSNTTQNIKNSNNKKVNEEANEEVRCYIEKALSESQERVKINSAASNYTKETSYTDRELKYLNNSPRNKMKFDLPILKSECNKEIWNQEVVEATPLLEEYEKDIYGENNNSAYYQLKRLVDSKSFLFSNSLDNNPTSNLINKLTSSISFEINKIKKIEELINSNSNNSISSPNNNKNISINNKSQVVQLIINLKENLEKVKNLKMEEKIITSNILNQEEQIEKIKEKIIKSNNKFSNVDKSLDTIKTKNEMKSKIDSLYSEIKQFDLTTNLFSERILTMKYEEYKEILKARETSPKFFNIKSNINEELFDDILI